MIDALTGAVLAHGAGGFVYLVADDTPSDVALGRWAEEVVPAVREAIAKGWHPPRRRRAAWASSVVAAARTLFGTTQEMPDRRSGHFMHPVVTTLGMSVILLAVMVPLGVRRYSRMAR